MTFSLALSGLLTWALVSRLEYGTAQDQLARNVVLLRPGIAVAACPARVAGRCTAPATQDEFVAGVSDRVAEANLAGDRVLVLDRPPTAAGRPLRGPEVAYDSAGSIPAGSTLRLGRPVRIAGQQVLVGTVGLDGQDYLVAATPMPTRYSTYLVLARPNDAVAAAATRQLIPPILYGAGAGLILAVIVSLLLARAFSRPLSELTTAAEQIAAGHYDTRVRVTRDDEIGVVGLAFNRMAEAVERTRAAERDFLANVSHELKTPLTSLIGFSEALLDGSVTGEQERARAVTIIHEEAQRMLRMSSELLDLARVESRQLELHLEPVDLRAMLDQEAELVRPRAEAEGLGLSLAAPSQLPPALADADRLRQILENLFDNAVKYAPAGSEVLVEARAVSADRIEAVVTNRTGAYPPDPARMFERFYRADPSRSSAAGGAGLGLAISRELAAVQSGSLTADLLGDSVRLRLELPVAPAVRAPHSVPPAAATAPAPPLAKPWRPPTTGT